MQRLIFAVKIRISFIFCTFANPNIRTINQTAMKKFFLVVYLLGIVACLGYSQSLSLSNANGPVPNNSYVNVLGLPSDDEIVAELYVTNNTPDSIPVIVRKVEVDIVPGTANLFCWGLCFSPSVFVSPDPLYIHGNTTNETDFSGHYLPSGFSGMSVLRYVFFDERNPLDSVCANINFQAYPLGIVDPFKGTAINAYPNPASGNVTFTYSSQGAASSITVRNLLGETVKEISLSGATGKATFNAGDLTSGIYFYSLVVNGNSVATKKLIVRD